MFFPFVCHNELPAAFRFLWVACISMIFAVNAGFALILAPFLRKNDCVSLMVGEPRRFFADRLVYGCCISLQHEDDLEERHCEFSCNRSCRQYARRTDQTLPSTILLLPLGDYSGRGHTVWLCLYSNSISRCDGGPLVGWKFLIRPACNRCDAGGCPRAVGPVLFD